MGAEALARLAAELRERGGLLASQVVAPAADAPLIHGAAPEAYALLLEAIREGYEQHYGEGRVVRCADPDLALLAGDRLYALGLERLAELGDLAAVAELADVISLGAQAHAEARPAMAEQAWEAGVAAVRGGTSEDHESDKARWRGGRTRA